MRIVLTVLLTAGIVTGVGAAFHRGPCPGFHSHHRWGHDGPDTPKQPAPSDPGR